MKDWQSQAHVRWDCKYHVVILPKYRRQVLYGRVRRGVGQILRDLCRQKDIERWRVRQCRTTSPCC
jgi:putative transposase